MARSLKTLQKNTLKLFDTIGDNSKKAIYYGFIPALLYLAFTSDPKPNIKALLGYS